MSLPCVSCAWVTNFPPSGQAVNSAGASAEFDTCSLELGRESIKDSGAFSVFLYYFSYFFYAGNVVVVLEEVVAKVLNLTRLK